MYVAVVIAVQNCGDDVLWQESWPIKLRDVFNAKGFENIIWELSGEKRRRCIPCRSSRRMNDAGIVQRTFIDVQSKSQDRSVREGITLDRQDHSVRA
jgi:hypothetical protein